MRRIVAVGVLAGLLALTGGPAGAIHFYRSTAGDCMAATGELGTPVLGPNPEVLLLHNTFNDATTRLPVTVINAGDTIRWTWNSEHCHSVTSGPPFMNDGKFDSGFVYPLDEPTTEPEGITGLFDYPVPELDAPTLAFSHTFADAGVFPYYCVHHAAIGMNGVVVVVE